MKTVILNYIDLSYRMRGSRFQSTGIKFVTNQIFSIFARVLGLVCSKLRTLCALRNVAMAVAVIAALCGWFSGVVASCTDSVESRITLVISVIVAVAALAVSLYKNLSRETEI